MYLHKKYKCQFLCSRPNPQPSVTQSWGTLAGMYKKGIPHKGELPRNHPWWNKGIVTMIPQESRMEILGMRNSWGTGVQKKGGPKRGMHNLDLVDPIVVFVTTCSLPVRNLVLRLESLPPPPVDTAFPLCLG
jgi:hypothetical protein